MCDRVMVLNRGRSIAIGSPEDLLRDSGVDRYQAWTRMPLHSAFESLPRTTLVSTNGIDRSGDWTPVNLSISGGEVQAAAVLEKLILEGAQIGRFEKVRLPLASLIEGLLERESSHGL